MTRQIVVASSILAFALVGVLPVLYMVAAALLPVGGQSAVDPVSSLFGLLQSARQRQLLSNTVLLSSMSATIALAIGAPLGLLLAKSDLPLKKTIALLFTMPLLLPPYIMAVAWWDLSVHLPVPAWMLSGLLGSTLVLSTIYVAIPMLLAMAAVRGIDPRLEEAARLSAPWPLVLWRITLPLSMPALALSWLLVFILCIGEYSVPSFFRYPVFSAESFTLFSAMYDFRSATLQALPMAIVALAASAAAAWIMRRSGLDTLSLSAAGPVCRIGLGRWRRAAALAVMGLAMVLVALPLSGMAVTAAGIGSIAPLLAAAGPSLQRSLSYGLIGAVILTIIGFFMGYGVSKRAVPGSRAADLICLLVFALPGTVLAIGLIGLFNRPETAFVYGSSLVIFAGYTAKYTALTERIIQAQVGQIPNSMEEAAQVAGAGWVRRTLFITIPLSRRGIVASWLVAFIFCLRDTDITMLIYPPGRDTLPVRTFTLMANGTPELVAGLCLLMFAALLIPILTLWLLWGRRREAEI
jgi:iron(III) transport system permease protein